MVSVANGRASAILQELQKLLSDLQVHNLIWEVGVGALAVKGKNICELF